MLEIKNINKTYTTGEFKQLALDNINIKFRKNEFVSILGPSGSGKTTLLNITSGLDKYDSGDLIINNKSTKNFKDVDWDAYRNNCIGFVFQNYNLISHISILNNVEMGLTLSGASPSKRRKKALEVLEKVGLIDHIHKKPSQLSGGQMQRVAIARALANNPEIILADEPTGALDTHTSEQIMNLIKEMSKDKLVIMVTHNKDIALKYSTRIIELKDGRVENDSNPYNEEENNLIYKIRKTAMSFKTALSLSFNNIKTKKGRTLLTAFASSIGIIGISVVLSLSNGFDKQISKFETDTLSSYPITVSKQVISFNRNNDEEVEVTDQIIPYNSSNTSNHINEITEEYLNYLNNLDKDLISGIVYNRSTNINLLSKVNNAITLVSSSKMNMESLPTSSDYTTYFESNYELLYGNMPSSKEDVILLLNENNQVDTYILSSFGITSQDNVEYSEIINKTLMISMNDDYYIESNGLYSVNPDLSKVYNNSNNIMIKIVGVAKVNSENNTMGYSSVGGILYQNELLEYIISQNKDSKVVEAQRKANYNILTKEIITDDNIKNTLLSYLGASDIPTLLSIYPIDFEAKEEITSYLDEYNNDKEEENKIVYNDLAKIFAETSSSIMDGITYVLIAFSAISLVVSGIMISIITYISVLERTKEIGILRSLGARKKDISRVFNAETFIIGLTSGVIGITTAYILTIPINIILKNLTTLSNVAQLKPIHALTMVIISISITLLGGFIPARMASKKDPVEALRTE
ncbi:MAG: ATP-binding cassette domain-containing protein [Bacilli bacterium]|nr:ATP-binding cassette domain-containing protein [Bacilli bacterium]